MLTIILACLALWLAFALVWSSQPTADERLLRRDLRQWRLERKRQDLRQWRLTHPLQRHGDTLRTALLPGLAAAVIALCHQGCPLPARAGWHSTAHPPDAATGVHVPR